ncbi:hypothetical protein BDV93DRAFT_611323 [Ceratobasidium sp. AG-I]|nr:hypothetical protein BDV93DRAFT_611323 [Ceratobasidium sp. AG-I]
MGKNKRKKSAPKAGDTSADDQTPLGDNSGDVPYVDGSDFTWLGQETMPLVDDPALHADCLAVLEVLRERKIGLGKFVWAVNYGNQASRNNRSMQDARKDFRGVHLVPTLHNVRIPPRTQAKGARTEGAKVSLDAFALSLVGRRLRAEMKDFEEGYGNIKAEELSEKAPLEGITFEKIEEKVHMLAPTLFCVLYMLGTCIFRRREWKSNGSDAHFVCSGLGLPIQC